MPKIYKVQPGSLAEELELEPGDELLKINGQTIRDIVDLQFALATEEIELEVKKSNGEVWVIEVEKGYDEGLGVEWENPTVDRVHLCHNKCVFCFVDQIPSNMRQTLNVRDDDYRLSFLHGNFVTLTNVKDEELQRIVDLKMSPLNVSVHTTNPELRVRMLANKRSGEILETNRLLSEGRHRNEHPGCPHTRVERWRRIRQNHSGPGEILSVGADTVCRACRFDETSTRIAQAETMYVGGSGARHQPGGDWQERFRAQLGVSFVHAADEFYVIADKDVPPGDHYDEFAQTENGVGVIRIFLDELDEIWPRVPANCRFTSECGDCHQRIRS